MKKYVLILLTMVAQAAFAGQGVVLEPRHTKLMEQEIVNECGTFRNLKVLSVAEEKIKVDQGIIDANYVTVLTGEQRYEQNIFEDYIITVESKYYDGWDSATGEHGSYSIESVKCKLQ